MRILSLLMVLVMMLGAAACTKNPTPAEATNPAETTAATDPAETEDPALADNLPAETFNGEEISLWCAHTEYSSFYNPDPDKKGDIIAEATEKRNAAVEDRFDVTFKWLTGDGTADAARRTELSNNILAGERVDLVNHVSTYLTAMIPAGCFVDIANVNSDIIDYSKPWYHSYVNENLKIDGRLYGVSNWFEFSTITRGTVIFFNMEMAENHGVGDLYQIVRDGDWTYEKMMEIAESVGSDLNNDGVYDDNDRYGLASQQDCWFQQVYTTGYQFVKETEDGSLAVSYIDDRLVNAFDTVQKIYKSNWYQSFKNYGETARDISIMYEGFNSDRILFLLRFISDTSAQALRDGGKFGILPTPKFTKEQQYGTATLPTMSCVPVTAGSVRTSAIILDALASNTYKYTRPAYFDVALSYKYVNDAESREMLDIAFANMHCDFGYMYMYSGFGSEIPMTLSRAANLASWIATYKPRTDAGLMTLVEQVKNLPQ